MKIIRALLETQTNVKIEGWTTRIIVSDDGFTVLDTQDNNAPPIYEGDNEFQAVMSFMEREPIDEDDMIAMIERLKALKL